MIYLKNKKVILILVGIVAVIGIIIALNWNQSIDIKNQEKLLSIVQGYDEKCEEILSYNQLLNYTAVLYENDDFRWK